MMHLLMTRDLEVLLTLLKDKKGWHLTSQNDILCLEGSNTWHKYGLGEEWLEGNPVDRDLGVLVHSSSIGVNTEPWKPGGQNPSWGNTKHHQTQPNRRGDCPALFFFWHWCRLTWSVVYRSGPHNLRKMCPKKGNKAGKRAARHVLWGPAKATGLV